MLGVDRVPVEDRLGDQPRPRARTSGSLAHEAGRRRSPRGTGLRPWSLGAPLSRRCSACCASTVRSRWRRCAAADPGQGHARRRAARRRRARQARATGAAPAATRRGGCSAPWSNRAAATPARRRRTRRRGRRAMKTSVSAAGGRARWDYAQSCAARRSSSTSEGDCTASSSRPTAWWASTGWRSGLARSIA